ncbi:AAA family ATPase [Nakamurella sp. YIM 132087]|uniref:AAA family ATPase n=2 Tax=Nakamurella alba TaxID=2665158 RepID=A0A7K1FIM3_9ACTN|nr:AAA family ATPase [Nakamurella alba]
MRAETLALRDSYSAKGDGTPGGRVQQDIGWSHHNASLTALNVAEDRLCFGRIDTTDGESMHIGRMGMFEEGASDRQLLMDWRAPSARPFYVATAAHPLGLLRRRHLRIRRRRLESLSDEFLDVSAEALQRAGISPDEVAATSGLAGESALMTALNAPRTGRMSDIVETIQSEQDTIIRSERNGVLVVQGGPGTGKTAVALHRAAYLLYTFREQLASRGVLLIGPNRTFLSYIGQVLPSLGENAVVLSTLGDLFPGVSATAADRPEVARIKGRRSMAGMVANALLDRQRMPKTAVVIESGLGRLVLQPEDLKRAQDRGWAGRIPHNRARAAVVRYLLRRLARQVKERQTSGLGGEIPFTAEDMAQVVADLREDEAVQSALHGLWPLMTAQRLLSDLYASPRRLAFAAPDLQERARDLLHREPGAPWTISDVPLLDEAAELLGEPRLADQAEAERVAAREYAQGVLDMLNDGQDETDQPLLSMISAADLAALREEQVTLSSTAERAAQDREWTYGHVVVDEAQELSPMAWRMVIRRCPARSMTLVGDIAQTSDPSGATSWDRALRPHVGDRWRLAELTVNYRTPLEISRVADRVLRRIDRTLQPPEAVRSTGVQPWWQEVSPEKLADATVHAVRDELPPGGQEHLAVLVPYALRDELADALRAGHGDLTDRVVVLTVPEAKGLEFDVVILVEPDRIEDESPRGLGDVYVALTRATQRLGVLWTGRQPRIAR